MAAAWRRKFLSYAFPRWNSAMNCSTSGGGPHASRSWPRQVASAQTLLLRGSGLPSALPCSYRPCASPLLLVVEEVVDTAPDEPRRRGAARDGEGMLDRIQFRPQLGFAVAVDGAHARRDHGHDFGVEQPNPAPEATFAQDAEHFPRDVPIQRRGFWAWLVARACFG